MKKVSSREGEGAAPKGGLAPLLAASALQGRGEIKEEPEGTCCDESAQ